jgi:hypothetical protein
MSDVRYDERTGRLEGPGEQVEALIASDRVEGLEEVTGGRPHERLAAALAAIREPVCRLGMQRGDRRGRGWVGSAVAALLVPAGAGRLALHPVPTTFVPDALARMNDVAPRPRVQPAVRLRYAPGDLARILATRDADEAGRLAGDEEGAAAAARTLVGALREHWRVEAAWEPGPESPGVRALEVLDTDAGVWLVIPDGPSVELWPSTPTMVFRLLTGLLPRDHELAGSE